MPLTAIGRCEAALVSGTPGATRELFSKPFFFIPKFLLSRILVALLATGMLVILVRLSLRRQAGGRWLLIPPIVGLAAAVLDKGNSFVIPIVSAQAVSIAAILGITCGFRKRRRLISLLLGFLINLAMQYIVLTIWRGASHIDWDKRLVVIVCVVTLAWCLPTVIGLVAVRRRFTPLRLAFGLLITAAAAVAILVKFLEIDIFSKPEDLLGTACFTLSYCAMFFVYAVFNPWCRQGLIRAWGLDSGRETACPA